MTNHAMFHIQLNHFFFLRFSRVDANEGFSIFYELVSSSFCGNRPSSNAFLFSLVNKPGWGPVTFRPPGESLSHDYAIYSCSSYGPTFGGGYPDIYIAPEASSNSNSYSYLGYTYNLPSGHSYKSEFARSFLAGSPNFQPDEVEVFYETGYK